MMIKLNWKDYLGILIGLISVALRILNYIDSIFTLIIIFIISFILYYLKIKEQEQTVSKSIIESLSLVKKDIVQSLKDRKGRIFPDTSLPNLMIIDSAINSIKFNGYIEFFTQNMGELIIDNKQLHLHEVMPGMNQRFMILINQYQSKKGGLPEYIRIYPSLTKKPRK